MAMENLSASDVLALTNKSNNDGLFGGNVGGILAIIIVFILIFGGGNGGFGWGNNNGALVANAVQTSDLYSALFAQDTNGVIRTGFLDVANKQANINDAILTTQYTDQLAMNNGFNSVNSNLNTGFMGVSQAINDLSHQMTEMCCDLKTTYLQGRYDDSQTALTQARNVITNQAQTQEILSTLGRYVQNPPVPFPVSTFGTTIA